MCKLWHDSKAIWSAISVVSGMEIPVAIKTQGLLKSWKRLRIVMQKLGFRASPKKMLVSIYNCGAFISMHMWANRQEELEAFVVILN